MFCLVLDVFLLRLEKNRSIKTVDRVFFYVVDSWFVFFLKTNSVIFFLLIFFFFYNSNFKIFCLH
jgi:hypothetical protein